MRSIAIPILALAAAAHAQTFEAASIKPNVSGSNSSSTHGSRGQIVFTNASLKSLIVDAFEVKPFQVVGPGWLETVCFDIVAKYPPDTPEKQHPAMLRALLEERFGLAIHKESKDVSGYALVVAKTGFKLQPVPKSGTSMNSNNNGKVLTFKATSMSMAALAGALARRLGTPVEDRTAIDGFFDVEMKWNVDDSGAATDPDAPPSLFTALQEKLGLRLQAQKVAVEMIVVDRVERTATEN
jgi:uncharacterized protein (TIGR03435 family)